jgi:HPt (histidine-containing phosphotransfer) domain-containing protein
MTSEPVPLLDPSHVADLVGLDKGQGAVFRRFVDMFVTKAPERLALLAKCAEEGDCHRLSETAHLLRGAAGNVGAFRLAVLLGRVEASGKTSDLPAAREALALLDAEYAATRAALLDASRKKK